jgi:hypothetical protein
VVHNGSANTVDVTEAELQTFVDEVNAAYPFCLMSSLTQLQSYFLEKERGEAVTRNDKGGKGRLV